MHRLVAPMALLWSVAAFTLPGCYQAGSVTACAVSCDLTTSCPGGLDCNAEGLCSVGGATCGGGTTRRLTVAIIGPGLVEIDGNATCDARAGDRACVFDIAEGAAVDLVARAAPGNVLLGWGAPCGGSVPTCTLTVGADTMLEVSFGQPGARFVSLSLVGGEVGNAMVRSNPPGLDCPPTCGANFPAGTDPIVLSPLVTGEPRWRGDPNRWTGCDREIAGTCEITSPGAVVAGYQFIRTPLVTLAPATFGNPPTPYIVTRTPNPRDCDGSAMCADRFDAGTVVSFTLAQNPSVRLDGWVATGATITSAPLDNPFMATVGNDDVMVEPRLTSMTQVNTVCGPESTITDPINLACGPNQGASATFPQGQLVPISGITRANIPAPGACESWMQAPNTQAFVCGLRVPATSFVLTLP